MKLHRIYAILLRYLYLFKHSYNRITDSFYWPTIDLLLWGLTSIYFRSFAPDTSSFIIVIVSGILLWIIVWRGQYEISVNLLEEMWNKNLINIFVSPLKFTEWVTSLIILGFMKAFLSISFAALIAYLLYKVQIFFYGFYLIPFILLLLMSGWAVGFFVAGLILRLGSKIETFAWSFIMIFSPFSAIYYPVSILPGWAQTISAIVPTSYVFEGAREVIYKGTLDTNKIIISFALNLLYLTLAVIFFKRSFNIALNKGLAKLY